MIACLWKLIALLPLTALLFLELADYCNQF